MTKVFSSDILEINVPSDHSKSPTSTADDVESVKSVESITERCRICLQSSAEKGQDHKFILTWYQYGNESKNVCDFLGEEIVPVGCKCRGSLALAHKFCIRQWAFLKISKTCEICKHKYSKLVVPNLDDPTPPLPPQPEEACLPDEPQRKAPYIIISFILFAKLMFLFAYFFIALTDH